MTESLGVCVAQMEACRVSSSCLPLLEGKRLIKTNRAQCVRSCVCCFVDMKGLIHQHTTMPSITAADSERGGTWGLYLLLSLGERSWITNVQADGFPLRNDSLDMLVRNNGGESPLTPA